MKPIRAVDIRAERRARKARTGKRGASAGQSKGRIRGPFSALVIGALAASITNLAFWLLIPEPYERFLAESPDTFWALQAVMVAALTVIMTGRRWGHLAFFPVAVYFFLLMLDPYAAKLDFKEHMAGEDAIDLSSVWRDLSLGENWTNGEVCLAVRGENVESFHHTGIRPRRELDECAPAKVRQSWRGLAFEFSNKNVRGRNRWWWGEAELEGKPEEGFRGRLAVDGRHEPPRIGSAYLDAHSRLSNVYQGCFLYRGLCYPLIVRRDDARRTRD